MKKATIDKLYRIDRVMRTILGVVSVLVLVFLVVAAFETPLQKFYITAFWTCAGVWAFFLICRIILSPFVKSDEEEELEQKIPEIMQKNTEIVPKDYTPLCSLSQEQEIQVKHILKNLPEHPSKPGYINLALIARYLTALEQLELANLENRHALRLWVQQVTGKKVPIDTQFNEAIPSINRKEVAKVRDSISAIVLNSKNIPS